MWSQKLKQIVKNLVVPKKYEPMKDDPIEPQMRYPMASEEKECYQLQCQWRKQNGLPIKSFDQLEQQSDWKSFQIKKEQLWWAKFSQKRRGRHLFEIIRGTQHPQDKSPDWEQKRQAFLQALVEDLDTVLGETSPRMYYYVKHSILNNNEKYGLNFMVPTPTDIQRVYAYYQIFEKRLMTVETPKGKVKLTWFLSLPKSMNSLEMQDLFFIERASQNHQEGKGYKEWKNFNRDSGYLANLAEWASFFHYYLKLSDKLRKSVKLLNESPAASLRQIYKTVFTRQNEFYPPPCFYEGIVYYAPLLRHPGVLHKVLVLQTGPQKIERKIKKKTQQVRTGREITVEKLSNNQFVFAQFDKLVRSLKNAKWQDQEEKDAIPYHREQSSTILIMFKEFDKIPVPLDKFQFLEFPDEIEQQVLNVYECLEFASEYDAKMAKKQMPQNCWIKETDSNRNTSFLHKCGNFIKKINFPNHICPPQPTLPPAKQPFMDFIEFYRLNDSRHFGMCLHCGEVGGFDIASLKNHITVKNLGSYRLVNSDIELQQGMGENEECFDAKLGEFYNIAPMMIRQPFIQRYLSFSLPIINTSGTILLKQEQGRLIFQQELKKGGKIGYFGGNLLPYKAIACMPMKYAIHAIPFDEQYGVVPLQHYWNLNIWGKIYDQPNCRAFFGCHKGEMKGFVQMVKDAKIGDLLIISRAGLPSDLKEEIMKYVRKM